MHPLAYIFVGGGLGALIDLLVAIAVIAFLVWLIMYIVKRLP